MRLLQARPLVAAAVFAAAAAAALPALAHPGHPGHETLGVWAGVVHPFTGADHLLAITTAGLWAALRGGRALVTWPATFLAAMAGGFVVGGLEPGLLEAGVVATVIILGALTWANVCGPESLGVAVAGVAGALHGMAHAADVGQAAPAFELGMLLATTLLLGAGVALGLRLRRLGRADLARLAGAGVAISGLVMAVSG